MFWWVYLTLDSWLKMVCQWLNLPKWSRCDWYKTTLYYQELLRFNADLVYFQITTASLFVGKQEIVIGNCHVIPFTCPRLCNHRGFSGCMSVVGGQCY